VHGRGGQGVIAMQTTERNGAWSRHCRWTTPGAHADQFAGGTLVRTPVAEISVAGRNTQGVRLIRLDEGERLTGVDRIEFSKAESRCGRSG
jgi:DNA gyrase subunit A